MNSASSLFGLLLFCSFTVNAQFPLRVNSQLTPEFLIHKVLVQDNSNVSISNIKYRGNAESIGAFSNESKYYIIKKGIILSTGRAESAMGPNQYTDMGTAMGSQGNPLLDEIGTGRSFDACELSFEFQSPNDSIKFNYIFASEEYPEFVHKGVNDIFAFFIEDLQTGEKRNLGVFGTKSEAINVDNINGIKNAELYIENGRWDQNNVLQWKDNPGLGELAMTYEYDGFTSRMSAGSRIIPGRKYRITFVIADVGDRIYDSAVFLEKASFTSLKSIGKSESDPEIMDELSREFTEPSVSITQKSNRILMSLMVHFDFDDHNIKADSSLQVMEKLSRFLRLHSELKVNVFGHTDNYGSEEYNIRLSEKRAQSASDLLVSYGIEPTRISTMGFGDNKPITDNITEKARLKNRRIEFELYR